jgi:mannose-1-phosphate guanylyltransferase
MLLSAGQGIRLRPLSLLRPKCLFPVLNRPMLRLWLERLAGTGARRVVINAFHLAPMIEGYVEGVRGCFPGLEILVSRETAVLGTGGGLRHAADLLGDGPVLVANSDIYSDFPLEGLASAHAAGGRVTATLAAVDRPERATVHVGGGGRILSFRERAPVPGETSRLCGAGFMVLEAAFIRGLPAAQCDVIAELRASLDPGGGVSARVHPLPPESFWCDMGTPGDYFSLNHLLARGGRFAEGARVEAETEGFLAAEPGAWIRAGARVRDSVLWSGAVVEAGATLSGMIVAGRARQGARMSGGVITGD